MAGNTISVQTVVAALTAAGFPAAAIPIMVAISYAESGFNTLANLVTTKEDSVGIFQINLRAHPSVSRACAQDPFCAAKAAYTISNRGTNFNPWTVYTSGAYKQWLSLWPGGGAASPTDPPVGPTQGGTDPTDPTTVGKGTHARTVAEEIALALGLDPNQAYQLLQLASHGVASVIVVIVAIGLVLIGLYGLVNQTTAGKAATGAITKVATGGVL